MGVGEKVGETKKSSCGDTKLVEKVDLSTRFFDLGEDFLLLLLDIVDLFSFCFLVLTNITEKKSHPRPIPRKKMAHPPKGKKRKRNDHQMSILCAYMGGKKKIFENEVIYSSDASCCERTYCEKKVRVIIILIFTIMFALNVENFSHQFFNFFFRYQNERRLIILLQACTRRHCQQKKYKKQQELIILTQARGKGLVAYNRFWRMKKATIRIQRAVRLGFFLKTLIVW